MHLSILSPITPLLGIPGGIVGDLIQFDFKNCPTSGAFVKLTLQNNLVGI